MVYAVFILVLTLLSFPLFCLISIGILISSGRPILFIQQRIGKNGVPFQMLKFRTMYKNAERDQRKFLAQNEADGPVFKIHDDPRFTPFGRFLSHTGLDELPQLWNVIHGDMALFGPRPLPTAEAKRLLPWQRKRQKIKPGILSPWVFRGYHRRTFDEWMKDDVDYVHAKSLMYDMQLFSQSGIFLLRLFFDELRRNERVSRR